MRFRLLAALTECVLLVALATVTRGQTDPNSQWPIDPRDVGKPWDPNLSELERVDAAIRYRAKTGQDKRDCQFGPVDRRISRERLVALFDTMHARKLSGTESWELLRTEPDDPNAAPVSVAIPVEDGPNCPNGDVTGKLFEERRRLIKEQPETSRQSTSSAPGPVVAKMYDQLSDFERTEAIMHNRMAKGLDLLPDCYYGPVQMHIPLARVSALLKESPELSGEEYWRWLTAQPQDPTLPALTILVRSGTLPDCPAGDVDERLLRERARLWKERAAKWSVE